MGPLTRLAGDTGGEMTGPGDGMSGEALPRSPRRKLEVQPPRRVSQTHSTTLVARARNGGHLVSGAIRTRPRRLLQP